MIPASSSNFHHLQPDGKDQEIDFSSIVHHQEVQGYVPQQKEPGFDRPLLFCDIDDIDKHLVGWKDEFEGFDVHNLVNDAKEIIGGEPQHPVFSRIQHWPGGKTGH